MINDRDTAIKIGLSIRTLAVKFKTKPNQTNGSWTFVLVGKHDETSLKLEVK